MHPREPADIDDEVRRAHGVLVVLHDDQSVAQISQMFQGVEKFFVVALMKPDTRFVEDIQHPRQPAADLRGKANPLRLAAGKRTRASRERKIGKPHVDEKLQPRADFF